MALPDASPPKPHPPPPEDLSTRTSIIVEHAGPWRRLHRTEREPLYFGAVGTGRFDAPDRTYGVLYVAEDAHGAFIETFGRHTGVNLIAQSELRHRSLASIESARALRLVDLTAHGLMRLGADARLATGQHVVAQQWSAAMRSHPSAPEGILYRARHDPSRVCLALFDHTATCLRSTPLGALMEPEHAVLLADILATYGLGLVDDEL